MQLMFTLYFSAAKMEFNESLNCVLEGTSLLMVLQSMLFAHYCVYYWKVHSFTSPPPPPPEIVKSAGDVVCMRQECVCALLFFCQKMRVSCNFPSHDLFLPSVLYFV